MLRFKVIRNCIIMEERIKTPQLHEQITIPTHHLQDQHISLTFDMLHLTLTTKVERKKRKVISEM